MNVTPPPRWFTWDELVVGSGLGNCHTGETWGDVSTYLSLAQGGRDTSCMKVRTERTHAPESPGAGVCGGTGDRGRWGPVPQRHACVCVNGMGCNAGLEYWVL